MDCDGHQMMQLAGAGFGMPLGSEKLRSRLLTAGIPCPLSDSMCLHIYIHTHTYARVCVCIDHIDRQIQRKIDG